MNQLQRAQIRAELRERAVTLNEREKQILEQIPPNA